MVSKKSTIFSKDGLLMLCSTPLQVTRCLGCVTARGPDQTPSPVPWVLMPSVLYAPLVHQSLIASVLRCLQCPRASVLRRPLCSSTPCIGALSTFGSSVLQSLCASVLRHLQCSNAPCIPCIDALSASVL
ncbi:UNVERIFIED_CONTAM: hypothetical protein FKN15_029331 [Acipenser sinensis]